MTDKIVNRVAQSGIISFDLEQYYPAGERVVFDIKHNLFQETILREKEFRAFVKAHNWQTYKGKNVAITCSVDAIVPTWAFMLIASKLTSVANYYCFGTLAQLEDQLFEQTIEQLDVSKFKNAKVVVKGCSGTSIPLSAYVALVRVLQPVVASLMFGEPCSTVPVYKQPKN